MNSIKTIVTHIIQQVLAHTNIKRQIVLQDQENLARWIEHLIQNHINEIYANNDYLRTIIYKSLQDDLKSKYNKVCFENFKLRQHLNRCLKDDDQPNWLERQKYMRNPQNMITRLQYFVRAGHSRFAIWITDLENFLCISWLFEVK